jgi:hypothetical protein
LLAVLILRGELQWDALLAQCGSEELRIRVGGSPPRTC